MDFIDDNLYKYCFQNDIGDFYTDRKHNQTYFQFTQEEVENLILKRIVFDGTNGGLIKGLANNSEGGIYTIMPVKKNVYIYANLISPGDFIISEKAYPKYSEEILEIENNSLLDNIMNYDLKNFETPKDCRIIDTGTNETAFVLLSNNPQIVLSKITTANHIKRLVEIESKYY